jgi:hypothetical protein
MGKGSGGSGMTRGDRRRNARRERLREMLPRDGAVIGIDLGDEKRPGCSILSSTGSGRRGGRQCQRPRWNSRAGQQRRNPGPKSSYKMRPGWAKLQSCLSDAAIPGHTDPRTRRIPGSGCPLVLIGLRADSRG